MNIVLMLVAQVIDIIVGALTKNPAMEPHLAPVLAKLIPVLSQAAGETPEQTAQRRADAEAIFAKHADPLVKP